MMVWWDWFCSLFETQEKADIDPYTWMCKCGHRWRFNKWQLLRMFFFEDYIYTCPHCQRKSRYRMITHVVRESDTDYIRENNKMVEDDS